MLNFTRLFFITLFIGFTTAHAQSNFVSENFNDEKIEGSFNRFIASEKGYSYVIAYTKKAWIIHKIDEKTVEPVQKWEVKMFDYNKKTTELMHATLAEDGFHLAFMAYEGLANEVTFVELLVKTNGETEGPKELGMVENVGSKDGIAARVSEDKGFTCISALLNDELGAKLFVFDHNWNKKLERVIKNPFEEKFTLTDVQVSNAGDVWLTGYRQAEEIKGNIKASKGCVVLKVDDTREMAMYDLKEHDKALVNLSVSVDSKRDTVLVHGFYSDQDNGYFNGVFQAQIGEKDLTKYSEHFEVIDESFLSSLDANWKRTRQENLGFMREGKVNDLLGLALFKVLDCYLYKDGGIALVAERRFYHASSQYATTFPDEVIVMKLSPNGKSLWQTVVSKKGTGFLTGYAMVHKGEDDLNIIFSGNDKNLEGMRAGAATPYDATIGRNGVVFITKVPSNGEREVGLIPNYSKERGWFIVQSSKFQAINEKSVLLFLKYGNRDSFKLTRVSL